jgi:hypothetical protein
MHDCTNDRDSSLDTLKMWLADPTGADPQALDRGDLLDPPTERLRADDEKKRARA